MNDHILLIIAVTVASLNGIASIARTIWHWEKRQDWKRKQLREEFYEGLAPLTDVPGELSAVERWATTAEHESHTVPPKHPYYTAKSGWRDLDRVPTDKEIAAGILQFHAAPFNAVDSVPQSRSTEYWDGNEATL